MDFKKVIITFLVGIHILPSSLLGPIKPQNTPLPVPTEIKTPVTNGNTNNNGLSITDEIYADLAMQHELDHVSVYYFDGNTRNTVSINADKNWDPASTIKLYAAMYAFDQASHGKISLDQNITIDAKNIAASESYPNGYPALNDGDNVTVFRLLDQMITQSDNTSFNTLLDLFNRQEITKYVHDLGLTNSNIGSKLNLSQDQQQYEVNTGGYGPNLITANDYATAFVLINGGRIPGSTDLFNILSRQKLNTMIPAYLPKTVTVAHKTGELDPDYHDGGIIVDANRRYVLSVFSNMGDPAVVAHISDLIYTNNVNLVGNNQASGHNATSEVPNAPIDPLVSEGKSQEASTVLAANTQNVNVPKVTASDIGIKGTDLANTLTAEELPLVIISPVSPLHFLVSLGEQIRVITNPIPSLRLKYKTENLKQDLAEANDLVAIGKINEANTILKNVTTNVTTLAKDPAIIGNVKLQNSIDAISETRFSILASEVQGSTNTDQKVELIKEIASQAVATTENIKPFITDGVKRNNLSQTPIVGEVIKTTTNSITIKTSDGVEVTTPVDNQIKTRDAGSTNSEISNSSQISVGSTIAVAGSFVLTNIASDSANPKPVTVLKVNIDTNTLVIQNANGVPQQIDLTKGTVIKGVDTSISLDQISPGDVIVVHGVALPATSSPSASEKTTSTPKGTTTPVGQTPGPTTSSSNNNSTTTATPIPTPIQSGPTTASKVTPAPKVTATPVPTKTTTPQVIKGNVIQVVQTPVVTPAATPKSTPVPTTAPKK